MNGRVVSTDAITVLDTHVAQTGKSIAKFIGDVGSAALEGKDVRRSTTMFALRMVYNYVLGVTEKQWGGNAAGIKEIATNAGLGNFEPGWETETADKVFPIIETLAAMSTLRYSNDPKELSKIGDLIKGRNWIIEQNANTYGKQFVKSGATEIVADYLGLSSVQKICLDQAVQNNGLLLKGALEIRKFNGESGRKVLAALWRYGWAVAGDYWAKSVASNAQARDADIYRHITYERSQPISSRDRGQIWSPLQSDDAVIDASNYDQKWQRQGIPEHILDLVATVEEAQEWRRRNTEILNGGTAVERARMMLSSATEVAAAIAGLARDNQGFITAEARQMLPGLMSELRILLCGMTDSLNTVVLGKTFAPPPGWPADQPYNPVNGAIATFAGKLIDLFGVLNEKFIVTDETSLSRYADKVMSLDAASAVVGNLIREASGEMVAQFDNRLANIYSDVKVTVPKVVTVPNPRQPGEVEQILDETQTTEVIGSVSGSIWRDQSGKYHYTGVADGKVFVTGNSFTLAELLRLGGTPVAYTLEEARATDRLAALEKIKATLSSNQVLSQIVASAGEYWRYLNERPGLTTAREQWHLNGFSRTPNYNNVFAQAMVAGIDVESATNDLRYAIQVNGQGQSVDLQLAGRSLLAGIRTAGAGPKVHASANDGFWYGRVTVQEETGRSELGFEMWQVEYSDGGVPTFVRILFDSDANFLSAVRYNEQGEFCNIDGDAIDSEGRGVYITIVGEAGIYDRETHRRLINKPGTTILGYYQSDDPAQATDANWVTVDAANTINHAGGIVSYAVRSPILVGSDLKPALDQLIAWEDLQSNYAPGTITSGGTVYGRGGNDVMAGDALSNSNDTMDGGAGNDLLSGGQGNDVLYGQSGNDKLMGQAGDDQLFGNDGADILDGYEGQDKIWGGSGADSLIGYHGMDTLDGGSSDDTLVGGMDGDLLIGGSGNDKIYGDNENTSLAGFINWTGNDTIDAGSGDDFVNAGAGNNRVDSGDGADTIKAGSGSDTIFGGAGDDRIEGQSEEANAASGIVGTGSVEGSDKLFGDLGNDTIKAGAGNDTLAGGKDSDSLEGGLGNDYLDGGRGGDQLFGGKGNDTLVGGLSREAANDVGLDVLDGGDGDDVLVAGASGQSHGLAMAGPTEGYGNPTAQAMTLLRGGAGRDTFILHNFTSGSGPRGVNFGAVMIEDFEVGEVLRSYNLKLDDMKSFSIDAQKPWLVIEDKNGRLNYVVFKNVPRDELQVSYQNGTLQVFRKPVGSTLTGWETPINWGQTINHFGGSDSDQITSYDAADSISGAAGDDVIDAGAGDDTIDGGDGWDQIFGGSGNDLVAGGSGHDILNGADGNDSIDGGENFDEIFGGTGNDSLKGGEGNDQVSGSHGQDVLFGDEGDDVMDGGRDQDTLFGGSGNDVLHGDELNALNSDQVNNNDLLYGQSGDDRLYGGMGSDTLYGGADNDTLNGGSGNDSLFGEDGDDTLNGSYENDTLQGGAGNDWLVGGTHSTNTGVSDNDLLFGGDGADTVDGGEGDDSSYGGAGNDLLRAGAGNDMNWAGMGNDTVYGGEGDDHADADAGDDLVYGEAGNDTLWGVWGKDTLDGGQGNDNLWGGDDNDVLLGGEGDDLSRGEAGDDLIRSGAGNDMNWGGTGNDTIYGGEGSDHADADAGDDVLSGEGGNDTLWGVWGNDTLDGGDGNDSLYGGSGNDLVVGGLNADLLQGEDGNDTLQGGYGDDTLWGGAGADLLEGGSDQFGKDTVVYADHGTGVSIDLAAGVGRDGAAGDILRDIENVVGSAYNDTITVGHRAESFNAADYLAKNPDVAVDSYWKTRAWEHWLIYGRLQGRKGGFAGYTDALPSSDYVDFDAAGYLAANADLQQAFGAYAGWREMAWNHWLSTGRHEGRTGALRVAGAALDGGAGNDLLTGGAYSDYIVGGTGNDTIRGGLGRDQLVGGAGNDSIFGEDDNDLITGGLGNDSLQGGSGNDELFGADGDDVIGGEDQNDAIYGGDGQDRLYGDNGNDTLYGGTGQDFLEGWQGMDVLNGEEGHDTLYGSQGNDTLSGGDGNDLLYGNEDDDVLNGGAQQDSLVGGDGNDLLQSGDGNDMNWGGAGNDTIYGGEGNDHADAGNDVIYGEGGDDSLWSVWGNDTVYGGTGNDSIWGGDDNDSLDGGDQNDLLYGESGDDTLIGGAGNDTLYGGIGSDTFEINYLSDGATGNDVIKDFSTGDVLKFLQTTSSSVSFTKVKVAIGWKNRATGQVVTTQPGYGDIYNYETLYRTDTVAQLGGVYQPVNRTVVLEGFNGTLTWNATKGAYVGA